MLDLRGDALRSGAEVERAGGVEQVGARHHDAALGVVGGRRQVDADRGGRRAPFGGLGAGL